VSESTVSEYRFVLETNGGLSFGQDTQMRFDVSTLNGVETPEAVTVYRRPVEDTGAFTALETRHDADSGELVATLGRADATGEFVLASDTNPLPVELARLSARTRDGAVRLSWQTASETGNAGFSVQRRAFTEKAPRWTKVGFVASKAEGETASGPFSYRFVDEGVPFEADSVQYRLRQVDADGGMSTSDPVTVRRGVEQVKLLGTAPNPARQEARLRYALPEAAEVTVELYDVLGRRVRRVEAGRVQEGRVQTMLDVSGLANGTYFVRLRVGDRVQTSRLTVVR
jgi:hypothetical protein